MVLLVGPLYFLACFGVFQGLSKLFKQKSPGREEDEPAPKLLAATAKTAAQARERGETAVKRGNPPGR